MSKTSYTPRKFTELFIPFTVVLPIRTETHGITELTIKHVGTFPNNYPILHALLPDGSVYGHLTTYLERKSTSQLYPETLVKLYTENAGWAQQVCNSPEWKERFSFVSDIYIGMFRAPCKLYSIKSK